MVSKKQQREAVFERERRRQEQRALDELAAYGWDFHPTKQYVRREGWVRWIQNYVERRQAEGVNKPWTYLTLPGKNALDIGFLCQKGLLERGGEGFQKTVAICDNRWASWVEKRIGPLIASSRKSLEKVIWQQQDPLVTNFPYDVINLDFCGTLLQNEGPRERIIETIRCLEEIFELQRGCGFLLLLTTRTGDDQFGEEAEAELRKVLLHNVDEEDEFRVKYEARYGSVDLIPCLESFTEFTQIVIPKIIARIARDDFYLVVERFAAKYNRVDRNGYPYDMICHTFELKPIGRRGKNVFEPRFPQKRRKDALGDYVSTQTADRASTEYRVFIADLVQRPIINVDQCLADHPGLIEELETEAKGLANWWERLE